MRKSPFSTVHFTFTVRVLAPLQAHATRTKVPVQTMLRRAMARVVEQRRRTAPTCLPGHAIVQNAINIMHNETRLAHQAFSSLETAPRS